MNISKKQIVIAFLFLISYVFLYLLSIFTQGFPKLPFLSFFLPLPTWISVTYFVIPLAGLVFFYYLIPWIKRYFETEIADSWIFPVGLIILSLISYYAVVNFYYMPGANVVTAQGGYFGVCMDDESCAILQQNIRDSGVTGPLITPNFSQELKTSSFIYFMLAGLLSWLVYTLVQWMKKEKIV